MDAKTAERRLYELWGEIHDIRAASDLLEWDQDTTMPAQGLAARGKAVATLEGLKHRGLTSPELHEVLEVCADAAPEGSLLAAQVRCAQRDVERAAHVPLSLARALAEARVVGFASWRQARETSDFDLFAAELERLIELKRQEASAIDPHRPLYDVVLDEYEPGATEAELVPLFARLRAELIPLVRGVGEGEGVDERPARGNFAPRRQREFGRAVTAAFGFDFAAGRLDEAVHPSCMGIDRRDVRLTWRYETGDFRPATFGILHEAGHGLYEQGLPEGLWRTPAGAVVSLGLHESQSRLWENHVGRSRGFWRWALPRYRQAFPDAPEVDVERMWALLHTVKPSLIRVEADEGTYNLHVAVRFELERALFAGHLEARDLPRAWDDLYQELLGIRPPDAARGVLQDIHWSQAMFGYFPTYTLGTMAAAQLFAAAGRQLGDLEAAFAEGDFAPLLGWLRERVHRHGSRYEAGELIERVTGKPLAPDDLLDYLRQTTREVYGVTSGVAAS